MEFQDIGHSRRDGFGGAHWLLMTVDVPHPIPTMRQASAAMRQAGPGRCKRKATASTLVVDAGFRWPFATGATWMQGDHTVQPQRFARQTWDQDGHRRMACI